MRIVKLVAENVKRLRLVEITPSGNIIEITGANASGKSSVLDSIFYALAGSREIPSQPIRRGALKAKVKLDLGEIIVTRTFTQSGGTLSVEAADGSKFASPQKMLDDLLGALTFDPLEFTRMDAKAQLEQLRSMVKLEVDLDAVDKEIAAIRDKRSDLVRSEKAVSAVIQSITVADGTPEVEVNVSDLLEEMREIALHNDQVADDNRKRTTLTENAQNARQWAADALSKAERLEAQAKECDALLAAIPVGEIIPSDEITLKIGQALVINRSVEQLKQRNLQEQRRAELRESVNKFDSKIESLMEAKREAIANAKMPIAGLGFGEGEVVYNGLPLNQASSAEQLRISTAIAMAANPKLRVLRIKDGSLLDHNSMQLLSDLADANDFQCWVENIESHSPAAIHMVDGAIDDDVRL